MLTVRFFASARAAAGVAEQQVAAGTLAAVRQQLEAVHGERLAKVMTVASFLINGTACRDHEAPLPQDAIVDVLPPFAGG